MGDSPLISDPLEALEVARLAFDGADDLTMAIEEEFAILDPATLEMTPGYERLAAAAAEVPGLVGMTAGELIRSEIEIKTGSARPSPKRPTRWHGGGSTWSTWPQRRGSACAPRAPIRGLAGRTSR